MKLAPLLLLLNMGYLVFVVCGVMTDQAPAALPGGASSAQPVAPQAQQTLDQHLPLPGMEGWDQDGDSCAAMEEFLQAASQELERLGA